MTLDALVVADDLTGAMDTGHEFAARGHPTTVAVGTDGACKEGVLVVNTDSRYLSASEARSAVERAVRDTPARVVYKKVDSTLRGNLTAEIEGALDATGSDCALVAPAFPAGGRLTACGFHLVEGTLVTDTDAGQDPEKPVPSAHLPTLLGAGERPVRHVGVETVARGPDAVAEVFGDAAGAILACDAVHDDHLAALARGAARSGRAVVYVGSAGLAGAVELPGGSGTAPVAPEPPADARVLGIAGSANPVTVEQLAALPEGQVVRLDAERAVTDPAGAATGTARCALEVLDDRGTAVVASVLEDGDVDRTLRAGREAGMAPETVRERVAESLAGVAVAAWKRGPPDGLFLTGGAVAGRVFDALGTTGVRLTGDAVEAGVPIGYALDGVAAGTRVVTKAGAFGDERTIVNCLARLGGSDGR
ncbi:MAG: four-carbon acid sugar kinase family protein [Haloarculaceae archaeon]